MGLQRGNEGVVMLGSFDLATVSRGHKFFKKLREKNGKGLRGFRGRLKD